MLIINDRKIIVFTPNKCASTSVIDALVTQLSAEHILGPQGPWKELGHWDYPDAFGKHSCYTPAWCKGYRKVIVLRDHFERFVSLWKHYCKYHNEEGLGFETFITKVELAKQSPPNLWFYWWPLTKYLEEVGHDAEIVWSDRLDQLDTILGAKLEIKHLHTTTHDHWSSYYTPQLYRRVYGLG